MGDSPVVPTMHAAYLGIFPESCLLPLTLMVTKHSAWVCFGKPCEVRAYIWWRFYLKLSKSGGKAVQFSRDEQRTMGQISE